MGSVLKLTNTERAEHPPPPPPAIAVAPATSLQIGVYPGVLQLVAMFVAMSLGFALSVGPAFPVFEKHTGLQLFMLGAVTTHLTVRRRAGTRGGKETDFDFLKIDQY